MESKRLKRLLYTLSALLILVFNIQAQQVTVSGSITEASTGEELIGVSIVEKGTTNGTITDVFGNYQLQVDGKSVLEISYVGYKSLEVPVNGRTSILVSLEEDAIALQEVVAIGYGSQAKKELTGSVTSVKAEDFNKGIVSNPMGLLQGKVAGLTIIKNGGDDPAQNNYNVQLRGVGSLAGTAEPLYVIDGVPGGNLSTVLPSDIESIDILKDGSAAAIYGTRANAGVILITTKRGTKDGSFSAEYHGTLSTGFIADKPRVLTAAEYRDKLVANGMRTGDYGHDTDWIKAITRTPVNHTHNVSLTGGTADFNYRASVGYKAMQGLAIKSDYEEMNARFAANQKALNKKLDIAYDFSYTSDKKNWANYDNFNQAIRFNPTAPIMSDDPKFEEYGGYWESDNFYTRNPVSDIMQTTNNQKDQFFLGSVRASLDIIYGLKFSTFYSLQNNSTWVGTYKTNTLRDVAGKGGVADQSQGYETQQVVENTLHYIDQFDNHSLQILLGQGYQTNLYHGFNAYNSMFPLEKILYNNLGLGEGILSGESAKANMGSYKYRDKLASFFARAMYSYDGRYFVNASARLEGSSKFGKQAHPVLGPWGIFPAISASWNINEEDFMQHVNAFDDLKLRLGYGVTGNMPGDHYLYAMRVGPVGGYVFDGTDFILPWGPLSNINEKIHWEEKHEYNIGLDFSVLDNRLYGSLDGYFRNTTDLLYEYDVPKPPYPHDKMWDNYGQIHNYGIELQLNANIMETKDLNWTAGFNASWNRNIVARITGSQYGQEGVKSFLNVGYIASGDGETGNYVMRLVEGGPIGNYWGLKYYGINSKGEWVFETPKGGFTTNPDDADKQVIGNAQPFVALGLNTALRYKKFDFVLNFRGQIGGKIFNETRYFYENTRGTENVLLSSFKGDAEKLTVWNTSGSEIASRRRFSDFYLENASYLKLNDLSIGYNPVLRGEINQYISNLRVSLTAQNVFTITGYKGHDPASVSMAGLTPGFDGRAYYPTQRSFNLGLSFNF